MSIPISSSVSWKNPNNLFHDYVTVFFRIVFVLLIGLTEGTFVPEKRIEWQKSIEKFLHGYRIKYLFLTHENNNNRIKFVVKGRFSGLIRNVRFEKNFRPKTCFPNMKLVVNYFFAWLIRIKSFLWNNNFTNKCKILRHF